jgi:Flp pilus assembly protein TadG
MKNVEHHDRSSNMASRISRRVRSRGEDGVATLEFALVSTFVLLPILAGIIQFGISYSQYQVLQGAAREGARCAAVQAAGYTDCNVQTAITNAALGYDVSNPPQVSVDGVPGTCTKDTIGRNVTVAWEQTFDFGFIGFIPVVPDSVQATISGTFRCE